MRVDHKQIGEVAERTRLSLRTIRYYEEVGLVVPSARSQGGFRLYSEADIARLQLVRRMKPLDFSLEEMRELLQTIDALTDTATPEPERAPLVDRLEMFRLAVEERCASLRQQLANAEAFAGELRTEHARHGGGSPA
ncbi:MerR family transcriptional regulator [Cellulomonas phragmiteti]|uniref:MerR family transcriptional regulator n=1 Tax=Cellulomonas phragmiteti TaxID=478780 RepID=A0ABQ4DQN6_9CELL|nr:MerR family transcriptional regulator [Cellulomonas phragmiteti]GIG41226.1 MerR family transcriptional regulator [Cellulomonas phragmiteti]